MEDTTMANSTMCENDTVAALPATGGKRTNRQIVRTGCRVALIGLMLIIGTLVARAQCSFTNTCTGIGALAGNTSGDVNSAFGLAALGYNTTGSANTAIGVDALYFNVGGNNNTATGYWALYGNTKGDYNTATGAGALAAFFAPSGSQNTAMGYGALNASTGNNNTALGYEAGSNVGNGNNNIEIGSTGVATDGGVIRIGTPGAQNFFYAAGIANVNVSGAQVFVSSSGQLGVMGSSRRYKEEIQDMGGATADLMKLRPVTFRYKEPFEDGSKPIQYGLIAEEVEEVYPDLVARSADGQVETVKYQALDSMLLNEVQRQQRTIDAQSNEIRALNERLAKLEAALSAGAH
jgi:hypothetical protein